MNISERISNIEVFLDEDQKLIADLGLGEDLSEKHYFYALVKELVQTETASALGAACQYLYLAQKLHATEEKTDQEILMGDYLYARFFQYLDVLGSPELTETFMKYMLDHNLTRITDEEIDFTREEFQTFVESICAGQQNKNGN